jgi:hypothetical protein
MLESCTSCVIQVTELCCPLCACLILDVWKSVLGGVAGALAIILLMLVIIVCSTTVCRRSKGELHIRCSGITLAKLQLEDQQDVTTPGMDVRGTLPMTISKIIIWYSVLQRIRTLLIPQCISHLYHNFRPHALNHHIKI